MVKKTITNHGRQSDNQSWRLYLDKLRQVLANPKTLALLMGWLRFVVAVARLFDHWKR